MASQVPGVITIFASRRPSSGTREVQIALQQNAAQVRPEVTRISRKPDAAGSNRERRAEGQLPDKKKGHQAAQASWARKSASDIRRGRRRAAWRRPVRPPPGRRRPPSAAPRIHPSSACGPCIAATTSGSVMNGPTPIMSSMFSATALAQAHAANQVLLWSFLGRHWLSCGSVERSLARELSGAPSLGEGLTAARAQAPA